MGVSISYVDDNIRQMGAVAVAAADRPVIDKLLRESYLNAEYAFDLLLASNIAAIPRLRRLRAQESVATDDGFTELSRSQTIEYFWGRECPNFGSRGFVALSKMPALRGLGMGCKNVDDEALSTSPHFPALQELTPIGFKDEGFQA